MSGPTPDFLADLRWRAQLQQCTHERELEEHLCTGDRGPAARRAYVGFDPTADSLTIGNLVPIIALRRFQLAGHTPVVVMGGGTGLIGDPSGKSAERQLRTVDEVDANVRSQMRIFDRVLDFSHPTPGAAAADNKPIVVNNIDWLGKLGYLEALRDIGKHFSVNMMIQKDSVKDRLHNRDQGISYTEFSYMVLQAYDFYHLWKEHGVTIQMGGSDQFGNIVVGIDLIQKEISRLKESAETAVWEAIEECLASNDPRLNALVDTLRGWNKTAPVQGDHTLLQEVDFDASSGLPERMRQDLKQAQADRIKSWSKPFGLTWPLVTKADGAKFGKTESGAVWLTAKRDESDASPNRTSPYQFYQFWLNTADADVVKFLKTFTFFSHAEIDELAARHEREPGKREAHRALARHMTELLHGKAELDKVEQATRALFSKAAPDGDAADAPFVLPEELLSSAPATSHERSLLAGPGMSLVDLLAQTSLAKSKTEARTQLAQNAISVNGRLAATDARVSEATLLPGGIIALRRGKKTWHITRWA